MVGYGGGCNKRCGGGFWFLFGEGLREIWKFEVYENVVCGREKSWRR